MAYHTQKFRFFSLRLLGSLALALWGCQSSDNLANVGCPTEGCPNGTVCSETLGQCLPVAEGQSPALEVIPPVQNNQGWVAQEFSEQSVGPDGVLRIQLEAAASLEGRVYSSDLQETAGGEGETPEVIPARIVAWRDSLLPGRPKVQTETTSPAASTDDQDSYVLWLSKGHSYTIYISPKEPYDQVYPPLMESGIALDDHMKLDFVLDGANRAVEVTGRVLDSTGMPLPFPVRVRAFKENGLRHSTFGETNEQTGEFSFRVPASANSYSYYTIRVETMPGSTPIPTMNCPDRALGLVPEQQKSQPLGDLQLPSFLFPKKYTMKIRAADGTPVSGATVTFNAKSLSPLSAGGSACTSSYSQTAISDSEGKAELWLLPGSNKNQVYSVTVVSPPRSPYASQWVEQLEVGPGSDDSANPSVLEAIVLDRRYRLSGQVYSATGDPIADATIQAQGITASSASSLPATKATATSEEDGSFELHVDPGIYNLEIQPPQGLGLPSFGLSSLPVEKDYDGLQLDAPSSEVLLGQVLDPSGQALTDAQVNVFELVQESQDPVTYGAVMRGSAITDLTGSFSLYLPLAANIDLP